MPGTARSPRCAVCPLLGQHPVHPPALVRPPRPAAAVWRYGRAPAVGRRRRRSAPLRSRPSRRRVQ
ncbi:MAG: hypothetical protein ACKVP7_20130 [Hyphomicrobiaceae bacterium]